MYVTILDVLLCFAEKKMLGLPPSLSVTKEKDDFIAPMMLPEGPLNPPIITHTAATPAATPQGSPNEMSNNKDMKNNLTVAHAFNLSSLSIDSIDKTSVSKICLSRSYL